MCNLLHRIRLRTLGYRSKSEKQDDQQQERSDDQSVQITLRE
jgi:hypothetical protein